MAHIWQTCTDVYFLTLALTVKFQVYLANGPIIGYKYKLYSYNLALM